MFSGVFSAFSSDALVSIANNSVLTPSEVIMASGKTPNLPNASCSSNVPEEHHSQWVKKFSCPECPFLACNKASLRTHMVNHVTRSSLQCPLCSFSVSVKNALMRHINRDHPEHNTVTNGLKKRVMMPKKFRQPSIVNTIIQHPTNFIQVPILMMPPTISPVEIAEDDPNNEREVHVEDQELDNQEIMVIDEDDTIKTCCLRCSKEQQGRTNPSSMVQCDECPLRHMTKLVQAIDTFNSLVYQVADYGPVEESEEIKCRKELNQLAEDIRVYRTYLGQASKEKEAEAHQIQVERAARDEHIRQRMEALKTVGQNLSKELAGLNEQKNSIQKKATEKTERKRQTELELFMLNCAFGSTLVNHQEASDSSLQKIEKKKIMKMEKSLFKLKNKLEEMGKQERNLDESIQTIDGNFKEADRNRLELVKERELLRALPTPPNPIAVARVKALKDELRERVDRFAYLEEQLIELNSKRIIDDIRLKKKEWLDSYDCHDNDDAEA